MLMMMLKPVTLTAVRPTALMTLLARCTCVLPARVPECSKAQVPAVAEILRRQQMRFVRMGANLFFRQP